MKQSKNLYRICLSLITLVFILTACTPSGSSVAVNTKISGSSSAEETEPAQQATSSSEAVEVIVETDTPGTSETPAQSAGENEQATDSTATVKPTAVGSPTPDLRLDPADWQNWSVIPQISGTAIDIYQRGLAMGNNPQAFSKVGDCQAIKEVLMGIYDLPDRYYLGDSDKYLQETIDYFAGSFNRDGYAVKGGFNAASVLSPIWADPDACLAGETPLDCEFRVHNPSIVIISLEVWWEGRTVERYEAYMRKIIDQAIAEGIVPILATKADNVEGDNSINAATVRLAYEYDIPLWNFWLAVQDLPNHGIDPERDGFHISTDAWNVRSYTALQAVDAVWRAGRAASEPEASEATPTTTVEQSGEVSPTDAPTEISFDGISLTDSEKSGSIIFGLAEREDDEFSYQGVYSIDLENQKFSQISSQGTNLQAISPDGEHFLVNRGTQLILLTNGQQEKVITQDFYPSGSLGVVWLADGTGFAYITGTDTGNAIHMYSLKDEVDEVLPVQGANPIRFYPANSLDYLYWEDGSCEEEEVCEQNGVWRTTISDSTSRLWGQYPEITFAKGSSLFSYQKLPSEILTVSIDQLDQGSLKQFQMGGDNFIDMQWSPVENKLVMLTLVRSDYSGKPSAVRVFFVDATTWTFEESISLSGLNAQVRWSPDGKSVFFASTEQAEDGGYRLRFWMKDMINQYTVDLSDRIDLDSEAFLYITNLAWVANHE